MVDAVLNQDNIEKGREIITDLVARFDSNKGFFTSNLYKEEEAKVEFINPMMEALGWDVHNRQGLGPNFKEVIFEESLAVGKETRAPDYSFRLGGQLIYYLEAKKPSVNIKDDRSPAYQARRYGWSAKIPIVILTDFEELAIYETTSKPKETERASTNRVLYYTYDEYVDKWEEIYGIFSKEAVQKELFQKFVDDNTSKTKRGTQSIDDEFLKDIEKWRLLLARNIALRNKDLTLPELNLAVQLIIDRIVFFRMAEDRGIERYQTLYKLAESENIYEQLCEVFKKADLKYNSGLFHFSFTPDYSEFVDNITLHLNIDDGVFKEIFADLYYPKSPYEFSVISPEILGNIYENFLGSIIRLTPSHQAKIEQKPEVKKAGGVFYTPQYIVDYIVENTVGELIKGKTPNQISTIKIIDPACGSGSFLLRAYQKLLDYHLEYYTSLQKPPAEVYYVGKDNVPRLTIREKKRILTNNIYGVDIDVNAVEVTKLSLLLKVLEDENKDVLEQQQKLYQEKVLPNLSYNIKCGNSLIGTDILEQQELEHDELLRLNPFNWEHEFPLVFANGGFDAVIGNPPYVSIETIDDTSKKYYQKNYKTFVRRADLYSVFLENSLNKIGKHHIAFIVPSTIFSNISYKKLRNLILDNKYLDQVCYTGYDVFKATVDTTILIMNKKSNKKIKLVNALNFKNKSSFSVSRTYFNSFDNVLSVDDENTVKIMNKIFKNEFTNVEENFTIFQGIVTGYNPAFIFDSAEDAMSKCVDMELLKPLCFGKEINQWEILNSGNLIMYIDDENILKSFPNSKNWLKQNKSHLKKYSLHRPRKKEELDVKNKILVQRTRNERLKKRIVATIDETGVYTAESLWNIIPKTDEYSIYFLLAILNSKLINYLFTTKFLNLGIKKDYLNKISFPTLSMGEQEVFINFVKKMLNLHKQVLKIKVPNEKRLIESQIIAIESKLNNLVYELYGLTEDEIMIIEDKFNE